MEGSGRYKRGTTTAEEQLRKKVRIYETILNSIHEGVLITDPAGYVVFYNQEIAVLMTTRKRYLAQLKNFLMNREFLKVFKM